MNKVLLTDNIAKEALEVFNEYGDIDATSIGTPDKEELKQMLHDYHAIIVRSPTKMTKDVIEAGTNLKFIGRAGVGVDNIDVDAATARGITVMNSPGGNTVSTAEQTCALLMALARRVPQADRSMRAGEWERSALKGVELSGKTLGVIGLGRVGREVARRMLGFDMRVVATDPYIAAEVAEEMGAEFADLKTVLREGDFITVHVPIGPETRGMISTGEIEQMKDGVFLVNCARGGVVDEKAVEKALASGKVSGVAFDVFEQEPPGENPLFSNERSVFTPHLGAATREAQLRVAVDVARNIADALATGDVRDAVNKPTS
jgi:D-3-phosphoglycerate dehydrogenase